MSDITVGGLSPLLRRQGPDTVRTDGQFSGRSVERGDGGRPRSNFALGGHRTPLSARGVERAPGDMPGITIAQRQTDDIARKVMTMINRVEDLRMTSPALYNDFKTNMELLGIAQEALSLSPGSPPEAREHVEHLALLAENLTELARALAENGGIGGPIGELAKELNDLVVLTKSDIDARISLLTGAPSISSSLAKVNEVAQTINALINEVEDLKSNAPMLYGEFQSCLVDLESAFTAINHLPGDHASISDHANRLSAIAERLKALSAGLAETSQIDGPIGRVATRMNEFISRVIRDVEAHAGAMNEMIPMNPLSEKAVFYSKSFTTAGAIKLIDEQLEALNGKVGPEVERALVILDNARNYLLERHQQMLSRDNQEGLSKDQVSELMGSPGVDKGIGILGPPIDIRRSIENSNLETGTVDLPLSHPDIREEGLMELFLQHVFAQAQVTAPDDLSDALLQSRLVALNEQPWEPIHKDVVIQQGGSTLTMKSSITPQSRLGKTFDDMKGGGVVCHMSQSYKHVPTLALSRLDAPDGTKLFDGIRHGTIAAYDISSSKLKKMDREKLALMVEALLGTGIWETNESGLGDRDKTVERILTDSNYRSECAKAMRARASYLRAQDVATSALVKNSDKLKEAIDNARSGDLSKEVSINLNSIGLLTPDTFRSILSGGESKGLNEKKMLEDQLKAWAQLSSEPQPKVLTVKDENGEDVQVRVRIKVNAFNFGVNGGAFHSTGLDVVSGWRSSDAQNAPAMAAMIGTPEEREGGGFGGDVGEWLRKAPRNTPEERQAVANVEALARQIAEMWDNRDHRRMGVEPYKMVSRLAVLSSMIGNDVCWNCKSGKDRTGECDVESKYLAMQIWLTGQVPEPDQPRTKEEKRNFFRMAVDGGNFELQLYNTAAPGFKLGGVPALKGELEIDTESTHYKYFKGIAGFYGS